MAGKILDAADAERVQRIGRLTNELFEATDVRVILALKQELDRATKARIKALLRVGKNKP